MQQRLASQTAQVTLPEREKFTAPLLLLPGLWTGSWAWDEAAWAFSQRGWACWTLDPRESGIPHGRAQDTLDGRAACIVAAAAALDRPPIVIGYDVGALAALLAAKRMPPAAGFRALVCVSPLVPRSLCGGRGSPLPLVRLAALPALLWNRAHPPPPRRMARTFLFHALPAAQQDALTAKLQSDAGAVVRELTRNTIALPAAPLRCPVSVIWGEDDRMVTSDAVRRFAATLQAGEHPYAGQGHWLLSGPPAAALVGDVHRWLVHTLGDALLLPPEEEPIPAERRD